MQITIKRCSGETYWYRSFVGETFPVTGSDDMNYYVEPPAGWGKLRDYGVAIEDAEALEPEGQLTLF